MQINAREYLPGARTASAVLGRGRLLPDARASEATRRRVFALSVHRAQRTWPVGWVPAPRSSRTRPVASICQLFATDTSSKKPSFSHPINFPSLRSGFGLRSGLFRPL